MLVEQCVSQSIHSIAVSFKRVILIIYYNIIIREFTTSAHASAIGGRGYLHLMRSGSSAKTSMTVVIIIIVVIALARKTTAVVVANASRVVNNKW